MAADHIGTTPDGLGHRQAVSGSAASWPPDDPSGLLEAEAPGGRGEPTVASASDGPLEVPATQPQEQPEPPGVECAICFEPVEHATKLPCACKVDYCASCWDRAMAQSFQKCGMARCPTCRSSVRVDYDVHAGGLVFSREEDLGKGAREKGGYFERTLDRLARQVRPAQVRLLRSSGGLGDGQEEGPRCVCGSSLRRVSPRRKQAAAASRRKAGASRGQAGESSSPDGAADADLEARLGAFVVCDLCNRDVPPSSPVWTCERGDRTILHAAAYDICQRCLELHCSGAGLECESCLQPVEEVLELPCGCELTHCPRCLDELLAESVQSSGTARCPACLAPLRVDFDAAEGRLAFSPPQPPRTKRGGRVAPTGEDFEQTVERLAEQVRPMQVRLLRAYGAAHPPAPGWAVTGGLVQRRVAQGRQAAPRCVCGCALWRVDLARRPGALEDGIVCDLCDEDLPPSGAVWTCENGGRTLVHATEYDICDRCFCSEYSAGVA